MCGGNTVDQWQHLTYQSRYLNDQLRHDADLPQYITYPQMHLIHSFRNASQDMAIWSMLLISCISTIESCTEPVYNRLHQAAGDIYGSFSIFYGPETAEQLINLLTHHIVSLKNLTEAILAGDQGRADELHRQWYQNAGDTAAFLAGLNSYWIEEQWYSLFQRYLNMMYQQLLSIATGDFEKGVDIFDRTRYHTILMSDYLSDGIMKSLTIDPFQPAKPAI
ncbi:MAG: hypothetical protein K0R19_2146 [Bacillota bacterium]|jgi:hypothetical protein|nr:hypothetical protein [Bacillota bacterium]